MKNKNNQSRMTLNSWLPIVGADQGMLGSCGAGNQARGGNEIDNGGKTPQFRVVTADKELHVRKNKAQYG